MIRTLVWATQRSASALTTEFQLRAQHDAALTGWGTWSETVNSQHVTLSFCHTGQWQKRMTAWINPTLKLQSTTSKRKRGLFRFALLFWVFFKLTVKVWQTDLSCKKKSKILTFCDYQFCFWGERLCHLGGNQWPPFSTRHSADKEPPTLAGSANCGTRETWPWPASPCQSRWQCPVRCRRPAASTRTSLSRGLRHSPAPPDPAAVPPSHSRAGDLIGTQPILPNQDFIILITAYLIVNSQIKIFF